MSAGRRGQFPDGSKEYSAAGGGSPYQKLASYNDKVCVCANSAGTCKLSGSDTITFAIQKVTPALLA